MIVNPLSQALMGGPDARRQVPVRPSVFQQPAGGMQNGAPGAWYQASTTMVPPSMAEQPQQDPMQGMPRDSSDLANALMSQGLQSGPVQTPMEGIGRLSQALSGAYIKRTQQDAEAEQAAAQNAAIGDFLARSGGLPEGYDPSVMPAGVNQAVLASVLEGQDPADQISNSEIGTFMTPNGPQTMTIRDGLAQGYTLAPDPTNQTTAEIVTGAALGLTGELATQPFEVTRDGNGNITNYSALGGGGVEYNSYEAPGMPEMDPVDAGYIGELDTGARSARGLISNLDTIEGLGFNTGPGTTALSQFQGIFEAVGMGELGESITGIDMTQAGAYASVANALALAMKDVYGLTGVMSDSDLALLKSLAPSPENTVLANQIISSSLRRAAMMKMKESELADQWVSNYNTLRTTGDGRLGSGDEGMSGRAWINSGLDAYEQQLREQDITTRQSAGGQIDGVQIQAMTLGQVQEAINRGPEYLDTLSADDLIALQMRRDALMAGGQ